MNLFVCFVVIDVFVYLARICVEHLRLVALRRSGGGPPAKHVTESTIIDIIMTIIMISSSSSSSSFLTILCYFLLFSECTVLVRHPKMAVTTSLLSNTLK